jgi:menaquinone-dependent protoporphyrinogen oxidase
MNKAKITRRRFLRLTGAAAGTCALSCAGLGLLLSQEDGSPHALTIGSPEITLGSSGMTNKILVAYATAAGSTGGVAELIGKTLAEANTCVDVQTVQSVTSLDDYDAVVLGSAIHGGKWLPEAVEFLQAHENHLNQVPTAFFLVGLMVNKQDEEGQKLVDQFLAAERALVQPVAEGRFVGAMFTKNSPKLEGVGMRFFIAYCGLGWRGGDFRDPAAIRTWAESLRPLLIPQQG